MRRAALVLFLSLTASTSNAQFTTGNQALAFCTRDGGAEFNMSHCLGLVAGLYDANLVWNKQHICLPANVTLGQIRDVFIRHIQQQASERHWSAGALMNNALVAAFPCPR